MSDSENNDNINERWSMIQKLLIAFMSDYTKKTYEELQDKFKKWADSKTESELSDILGKGATVKKVYRSSKTNEKLHTKDDIIKSMSKYMGQNGNKHI